MKEKCLRPGANGLDWNGKIYIHWDRMQDPLSWKKPKRIAAGLMGDPFHPAMTTEALNLAFVTMVEASRHEFYLLTKRPVSAKEYVSRPKLRETIMKLTGQDCKEWPPKNILIGATIENQVAAEISQADMQAIANLGWRTFVSYEPAIGPVDWEKFTFLKWLIAGGEKGPRPAHPDWIRKARDWCKAKRIPFHFKGWGKYMPIQSNYGGCDHPASSGMEYCQDLNIDKIWKCDLCQTMHGLEVGGTREKTVTFSDMCQEVYGAGAPFDLGLCPTKRTKELLKQSGFRSEFRMLDGAEYLEFPN
jgi:protein gp37